MRVSEQPVMAQSISSTSVNAQGGKPPPLPASQDAPAVQGELANLSPSGKLMQELDGLFAQVDGIYESKFTAEDKRTLDEAYAKLDKLFGEGEPSEADEKVAEQLFAKVDAVFEKAESKMSAGELKQLTALDQEIGEREDKLDVALEQELGSLLASKLSSAEKKELDQLNEQLSGLFAQSNLSDEQQETVDSLFGEIDKLVNKSFNQLSEQDQEKVMALSGEIDALQGLLDGEEEPVVYAAQAR